MVRVGDPIYRETSRPTPSLMLCWTWRTTRPSFDVVRTLERPEYIERQDANNLRLRFGPSWRRVGLSSGPGNKSQHINETFWRYASLHHAVIADGPQMLEIINAFRIRLRERYGYVLAPTWHHSAIAMGCEIGWRENPNNKRLAYGVLVRSRGVFRMDLLQEEGRKGHALADYAKAAVAGEQAARRKLMRRSTRAHGA